MPDYEQAEEYYDGAMTVLPKDYPDYKNIAATAKGFENPGKKYQGRGNAG